MRTFYERFQNRSLTRLKTEQKAYFRCVPALDAYLQKWDIAPLWDSITNVFFSTVIFHVF